MTTAAFTILFLLLFAIVLVAISFGYRFMEAQRKKQVANVLNVVSGTETLDTESSILRDLGASDPIEDLLKQLDLGKQLQVLLTQAGLPWSPARFVILSGLFAGVGGFLGGFFKPFGSIPASVAVMMGAAAFVPLMYARIKRGKRMDELETQLPEALDFLARSMRAGHAFSISLEMLGQESPDPLGQEFRVLFNEQNLGAPMDVALESFIKRVPLLDIRLFVSAILLQKQTGGNLSEILVRLSYVIRERFRLKGQVKAASAHGRLTAIILTLLPVVVVLALLFIAPGYLQGMLADPDGRVLVLAAVAAQALGFYFMRRITNIKV